MKATRYLFTFLVLATLALSSCHNDDLPDGNTLPEGAVHITAASRECRHARRSSMPTRRLIRACR